MSEQRTAGVDDWMWRVMPEERKTKRELLQEINELRHLIAQLEQADTHQQEMETASFERFPDENPNPVLRISDQGTLLYANKASIPVLEAWRIQVGGRLPETCYERVMETLHTTKVSTFDFNCDNGRIYWVILVPVADKGYLNAYGVDITERRRMESELRKFKTISDKAGYGIALSDLKGNLTYINESFARIHEYEVSELIGRNLSIFHNKEQMERVNQLILQLKRTGSFISEEVWHIKKDNSVFCALMNGTLINDENGQPQFMACTAVDITQNKKTESQLIESEEKYRTLIESAGESIATINTHGVFLFINTIGAERLGGKPEDYIGKTMWDIFPKEIADHQVASIQGVIKSEQGKNLTSLTELQGQSRWYHTTLEPIRDSCGKVVSALVIARDIHELRQAQDKLNTYREQMVRAEQLASLGTVGAMAAHELTQPLTVVRLSIENALMDLDGISCPNGIRDGLKDSLAEISQAVSLIDRLRHFARVSSDREVKYVQLDVVARRVIQLLEAQIWRTGMTVSLNKMDNLPLLFTCEKDMEQLFFALVENTIQATNGKKGCQLFISGSLKDQDVELQFSDTCGGIPPQHLDRIFEPFFTTKPVGKGTGLGLCVVERIISQAGGHIRVESTFDEGTKFFVSLPIKQMRRV